MLLIKTTKETLLSPLQKIQGIVEKRHTLPILANIMLDKQGSDVRFTASDIEIQMQTLVNFGDDNENQKITVNARKFLDILKALPAGEVSVSLKDKKIAIQSGRSKFNLQTLPAEDFPIVEEPEVFSATLVMSQKSLKQLLSMVHFAMAQQDIRYYLNGLLLVIDGKKVKAVTTDGHRLAYYALTLDVEQAAQEIIIPRKAIVELQRLLEENDKEVQIDIATNQIKFSFEQTVLISKLVEGRFPDYQRVIPQNYPREFNIERETLLHSLQRVAILSSDKLRDVRWVLTNGELVLTSNNADQEEANEVLEIDYNGGEMDIGFNVNYLIDVLTQLKCDQVKIALNDGNSSVLITLPESDDFKYVVMPMRI